MVRIIIDTTLQILPVSARYIKILHFIQVVNRFICQSENLTNFYQLYFSPSQIPHLR